MNGSRPLQDGEIKELLNYVKSNRNKALIYVGLKCGYRISEILSLTADDVVQYGKIRDSVTVVRKNMKGKTKSRTVVMHDDVKKALVEMQVLAMKPEERLFPISRVQASRIFVAAAKKAELEGKVTTHSMRKTFAKKVYHALGKDLIKTQKAMGHENIQSTVSYLSFEQSEIDDAIRGV
jgi:integrase